MLSDKDGELARMVSRLVGPPPDLDTPERAFFLRNSLVNWILMGTNLLRRGEYARADMFLIHRHLLQAARLVDGTTANWLSPSRRLEEDLSSAAYERFRACTAALDAAQLARAYRSTWAWGKELIATAKVPRAFLERLTDVVCYAA